MEHGHFNPKLETESSENSSVGGLQDEGGVDTTIAGPSEPKESLSIKLEIDQSIETTKLKINNDNIGTLQSGNNNIIETIIQDSKSKESEKIYICKFCFQVFDKHQALGGHMNGHSKDDRNLEKFGKVTTWIHATYPPPLNTTLASEVELQGTLSNGTTYNSYNHLAENGNTYNQLGGHLTNQQSTPQIQLSQELQLQQQQLQYYQAQELQRYQYSQQLQSNQALESLQNTQALQSPQNNEAPQRLQNYQTPIRFQNHQASQGSQSYQTLQQFQNDQIPQELEYYQALQGSQNYRAPRGPQYHQTPQRFQNYQAPQGPQSYQTPQGSQSYQAPQRPQSYQTLQGSQSYQGPQRPQSYQTPQGSHLSYQAPQRPQSYQTPQGSQSYQAPQGQWQQLVDDANNQQNINLNSKTSNKPTSLDKVPSSEQKNNSSNFQGLHFQKEAQGTQRYMPNPDNLRNGDRLTTGIFINEQLNKEYYAQLGSNVLKKSNHMISILPNCDATAQYRPTNSQDTSSSCSQSKDE